MQLPKVDRAYGLSICDRGVHQISTEHGGAPTGALLHFSLGKMHYRVW